MTQDPRLLTEPKLEAPGKGLPLAERLVARYWIVPRAARKASWDVSSERFLRESEKILELVAVLPQDTLNERVLVPRLTGIEDSSRFWSPAMCLEHLMITAPSMAGLIVELSRGRVPDAKVDIAKVKPSREARSSDVRAAFRAMVAEVDARLATETVERGSKARFAHPWFGRLTAHEWHWILASHQWVHRKQLEAILKQA